MKVLGKNDFVALNDNVKVVVGSQASATNDESASSSSSDEDDLHNTTASTSDNINTDDNINKSATIRLMGSTSKASQQGQDKLKVPPPLDVTESAAMEAAHQEIQARMASSQEGSISAAQVSAIVQEKMKVVADLWTYFPGARSSAQVLQGYQRVVEKRGYTPENTLFAQSICPDEVNHEEGDITNLFTEYCGEVFHMGGLAGIPFTGKVGFGAFSHHVPDGGHCAILLAPHIGMDDQGRLGLYSRHGQSHSGSCCGAAVGAYAHCRAGKEVPDLAVNPEFYQFNYIINQVHRGMESIQGETEDAKQASLARLMHKTGTDLLSKCVSMDFGTDQSTLIVLTGIQINMPRPFADFFLPLEFYIQKKDGSTEDVFEEAFGDKP